MLKKNGFLKLMLLK